MSPVIQTHVNKKIGIFKNSNRRIDILFLFLFLSVYIFYAVFVLNIGTGPIDYETFMKIGQNLIELKQIYGENSYYPMPFVGLFAIFSQLPFSISFLTWAFFPVLIALIISGFSPLILLFAPLFGHFLGGQSAVFGMLGLWGYRKNQQSKYSGIWLSLLLLKPQLAIAPLGWVAYKWIRQFFSEKKVPDQIIVFLISTIIIYLPWFVLYPTWFSEWLGNLRGFRIRAMAGIFPRAFTYLNLPPIIFWLLLLIIAISIIYLLYKKRTLDLDKIILLSFIVLPFLHDYDLIQVVPLLDNQNKRIWAIISSIPLWFTIFLAYNNDHAWFTATLIAPILLYYIFKEQTIDDSNNQISNLSP